MKGDGNHLAVCCSRERVLGNKHECARRKILTFDRYVDIHRYLLMGRTVLFLGEGMIQVVIHPEQKTH